MSRINTVHIFWTRKEDAVDETTTLQPRLVVAYGLAFRWSVHRSKHWCFKRISGISESGDFTSMRYILQQQNLQCVENTIAIYWPYPENTIAI